MAIGGIASIGNIALRVILVRLSIARRVQERHFR
jgi:hypothetical protein